MRGIPLSITDTPLINRPVKGIGKNIRKDLPVTVPYLPAALAFPEQKPPILPEGSAISAFIGFLRFPAPGDRSLFQRHALPIQKPNLIAEKTRHIGKCFLTQPFPIAFICKLNKICHFLPAQRIEPRPAFQADRSVVTGKPLTPALRETLQDMPVGVPGGPAVLIINPEFQSQLLRIQNCLRQLLQIFFAHISGPARIISGMENRSLHPQALHFVQLPPELWSAQFPIDRPKAQKLQAVFTLFHHSPLPVSLKTDPQSAACTWVTEMRKMRNIPSLSPPDPDRCPDPHAPSAGAPWSDSSG